MNEEIKIYTKSKIQRELRKISKFLNSKQNFLYSSVCYIDNRIADIYISNTEKSYHLFDDGTLYYNSSALLKDKAEQLWYTDKQISIFWSEILDWNFIKEKELAK